MQIKEGQVFLILYLAWNAQPERANWVLIIGRPKNLSVWDFSDSAYESPTQETCCQRSETMLKDDVLSHFRDLIDPNYLPFAGSSTHDSSSCEFVQISSYSAFLFGFLAQKRKLVFVLIGNLQQISHTRSSVPTLIASVRSDSLLDSNSTEARNSRGSLQYLPTNRHLLSNR